jgi:hypothetical protein
MTERGDNTREIPRLRALLRVIHLLAREPGYVQTRSQ